MNESILAVLQEYLETCPLLRGRRLNVDYLPKKPIAYMLSPSPADSVVTRYHGGAALRQLVFVLASVNLFGEEVLTNLANSGFYEALEAWMRTETRRRRLPKLPDGCTAMRLEALSTGYLYDATATEAHYQIQCRLVYYQRGDY